MDIATLPGYSEVRGIEHVFKNLERKVIVEKPRKEQTKCSKVEKKQVNLVKREKNMIKLAFFVGFDFLLSKAWKFGRSEVWTVFGLSFELPALTPLDLRLAGTSEFFKNSQLFFPENIKGNYGKLESLRIQRLNRSICILIHHFISFALHGVISMHWNHDACHDTSGI